MEELIEIDGKDHPLTPSLKRRGDEEAVSAIDSIIVRGARVHNLKGVDVDIPREKLVVITGISGSGKSSLAFDTIYAEGQRRYVESLSPYARQFLDMMERPDCDFIEGLSPAISIEQKTIGSTPRSTVGTVTEIYDFIRLLFARTGVQYCVDCNIPVTKQSIDQIIDALLNYPNGTKITIYAPVVRGRKGQFKELFRDTLRQGFTKARIDGAAKDITESLELDRYKAHTIEIVIDQIVSKDGVRERLTASVETALKMSKGTISAKIQHGAKEEDVLFSEKYSCPQCGRSYEEPQPNTFSFNSATNACPSCHGLGVKHDFAFDLIIPNKSVSVEDGGIVPIGKASTNWLWAQVRAVFDHFDEELSKPIAELPEPLFDMLMNGSGKQKLSVEWTSERGRRSTYQTKWAGIYETLRYWFNESGSEAQRGWAEEFMAASVCPACNGGRLKPEHLAIRIDGKNVHDIVIRSLDETIEFFRSLSFSGMKQVIAEPILREIVPRIDFLLQVGLSYLSLDRAAQSLSGGESQRIRLATQIGTQLVGVLYILDEPSIGLHQRDNRRLIHSLEQLRDLGNTVVVVEHDKEMMESADLLIDIGPRAGEHGGKLVAYGPPALFQQQDRPHLTDLPDKFFVSENSPTARYLSGKELLEIPKERIAPTKGKWITLSGATGNNLKDVTFKIPVGTFTCITGVSGSGKSTLVNETLAPILNRHFYSSHVVPLPYAKIEGLDAIDKVIEIDQTPIGRTPRSNPATYTGLFSYIRDFFASLPESNIRGYKVGRFSFNVKSGRCEACEGDGVKKIEMNFLPDVYVTCDVCKGKRYNRETLEVRYKGKSIADVLEMSVTEAEEFFSEIPRIKRKLHALSSVGMGYIHLGQQAPTLSGGEAQRVKLATELSKVATGKTIYILDEPTTGLHFEDIKHLMNVLLRLREKGNTVLVIEHNLDVIKMADWVIDLGPEGGSGGGRIVDEGTPEAVAKRYGKSGSHTAFFLRKELGMPVD